MKKKALAPKTRRKSRQLRLATSSTGTHFDFEPEASDWEKLERAIGKPLSEALRGSISEAVDDYFTWQPFESAAPRLDNALKRTERIKSAAVKLRDALQESRRDHRNEQSFVRIEIGQRIDVHGIAPGIDALKFAEKFVRAIIFGASDAAKHFSDTAKQGGFEEGRAWQSLMTKLRSIMKNAGLRSGAAHSTDKSANSAVSPFVRFVIALQKTFPDESLRRHNAASPHALAKEINRAANAVRKRSNGTLA